MESEAPVNDAALLARVSAGDREAFASVLDRHEARVFRFALSLSRDENMAADATQEAFIFLLRSPGSYAPARGTLQAFLLGTVRIIVLKMFRGRRSRAETELEEGAAEAVEPPPAGARARGELFSRLNDAVEELSPLQRQVIELRFRQELPLADIAAALSLPLNTVKSHLKRGVERLRRDMTGGS